MEKSRSERLADSRLRNKRWRQQRPQLYLWNHAKQRARRKGLPFAITPEDIELPEFCPVFGWALAYGTVGRHERDRSASIDRIIPELGYIPGNIRTISFRANLLRQDASADELRAVADWLCSEGNLHGRAPRQRPRRDPELF